MSEKIPYEQVMRRMRMDIDYIADEAYHKGFEAGQHEATTLEYQQGLDDAWVAAKKICTNWMISDQTLAEIFGQCKDIDTIMHENTAQEAINKIKAYEESQKANAEIKVGDEVEWEGEKIIVTKTFTPNLQKPQLHGIGSNGCVYYAILIEDVCNINIYPSQTRFVDAEGDKK